MGIVIRTRDVNFEDGAVGFLPPVTRGLAYWNYIGGNADKTARNLAPKGLPSGTIVGSPTYGAGYASLSQSAYIQTQALQSADITMIAVVRPKSESGAVIISNNGANNRVSPYTGQTFGASMWNTAGAASDGNITNSFNQNVFDGNSATAGTIVCAGSLALQNINQFHCFSGVHDSASHTSVARNLGLGGVAAGVATSPNTIPDLGVLPFRIGYSYSTGLGTAESDIAFAAIYNTALTIDEQLEVYNFVKSYLATKSISI